MLQYFLKIFSSFLLFQSLVTMFSTVALLFFVFEWNNVYAILPPMEGKCESNYIEVNPLAVSIINY